MPPARCSISRVCRKVTCRAIRRNLPDASRCCLDRRWVRAALAMIGFAALNPSYATQQSVCVGWVERSETHRARPPRTRQRGSNAGANTGMPGRQRRRDTAAARRASLRACRVPRQPARGAIPLPPPARLHRGGAGAGVPARRRRRGRRGARSRRRHLARRVRQPGVPPAGRHAVASAARRLRSRRCHPWLLSRRLSLRRAEGGQARPGAAAGARAAAAQPFGGRRHLDGARPGEHAGQPARPRGTRRVRRLARQALRRRDRNHHG